MARNVELVLAASALAVVGVTGVLFHPLCVRSALLMADSCGIGHRLRQVPLNMHNCCS